MRGAVLNLIPRQGEFAQADLRHSRLPLTTQIVVGILLTAVLVATCWMDLQLPVLIAVIGVGLFTFISLRPWYSLSAYVLVNYFIITHDKNNLADGAPSALEVVMGLVLLGVAFVWIARWWLERRQISTTRSQLVLFLFFFWSIVISASAVIVTENTWSAAMRELINFVPLLVLPVIYERYVQIGSKQETRFFSLLVVVWLAMVVQNVLLLRSNILEAAYLFEMGRAGISPTSSLFLTLLSCSLLMTERFNRKAVLYLVLFVIGLAAVFFSMYRTLYFCLAVELLIMFVLARGNERRQGVRHAATGLGAVILMLIPIASKIRLITLFLLSILMRFLAGTHAMQDPSLLNRFAEAHAILASIKQSPITGWGFGAHYLNWNIIWFANTPDGFSHNGYLFIAFKSGLVGAVMLYGVYVAFAVRAIQLARRPEFTTRSRAILRSIAAFLVGAAISNYTLNFFGGKADLIWIALMWGYLLAHERMLREAKRKARVDGFDEGVAPSDELPLLAAS